MSQFFLEKVFELLTLIDVKVATLLLTKFWCKLKHNLLLCDIGYKYIFITESSKDCYKYCKFHGITAYNYVIQIAVIV